MRPSIPFCNFCSLKIYRLKSPMSRQRASLYAYADIESQTILVSGNDKFGVFVEGTSIVLHQHRRDAHWEFAYLTRTALPGSTFARLVILLSITIKKLSRVGDYYRMLPKFLDTSIGRSLGEASDHWEEFYILHSMGHVHTARPITVIFCQRRILEKSFSVITKSRTTRFLRHCEYCSFNWQGNNVPLLGLHDNCTIPNS